MSKCVECGAEDYNTNWLGDIRERMEEAGVCFNCLFWLEKVEWAKATSCGRDSYPVRIEGTHYTISPDVDPRTDWAGHGGHEFRIRMLPWMKDSRVVVTHNLWYQGEIPDHFRDRLPDNAEWVH